MVFYISNILVYKFMPLIEDGNYEEDYDDIADIIEKLMNPMIDED